MLKLKDTALGPRVQICVVHVLLHKFLKGIDHQFTIHSDVDGVSDDIFSSTELFWSFTKRNNSNQCQYSGNLLRLKRKKQEMKNLQQHVSILLVSERDGCPICLKTLTRCTYTCFQPKYPL